MLKLIILSLLSWALCADGPVVKTGQDTQYLFGDDGTYKAGLQRSYSRDSAVNVVTDRTTKLQWQDVVPPFMEWSAAQTHCAQLNVDGTGWRLPSKRELETLVDYSRSGAAVDPIFENIAAANYTYWSSTPYISDNTQVGVVTFYNGYSQSHQNKTAIAYVQCVRQSN